MIRRWKPLIHRLFHAGPVVIMAGQQSALSQERPECIDIAGAPGIAVIGVDKDEIRPALTMAIPQHSGRLDTRELNWDDLARLDQVGAVRHELAIGIAGCQHIGIETMLVRVRRSAPPMIHCPDGPLGHPRHNTSRSSEPGADFDDMAHPTSLIG